MVLVCLSSDALLQNLPSYLGFSYLGHGVSLHGCSSKEQIKDRNGMDLREAKDIKKRWKEYTEEL